MPRRQRVVVEVLLYSFFNPGARWGGWLTQHPGRFTPRERGTAPLYRRLGGPQGRSERARKILPRPARSESLYRPSYPGAPASDSYTLFNYQSKI